MINLKKSSGLGRKLSDPTNNSYKKDLWMLSVWWKKVSHWHSARKKASFYPYDLIRPYENFILWKWFRIKKRVAQLEKFYVWNNLNLTVKFSRFIVIIVTKPILWNNPKFPVKDQIGFLSSITTSSLLKSQYLWNLLHSNQRLHFNVNVAPKIQHV